MFQNTKKPLPYLGGLALNHTSRIIRRESLAVFLLLLNAHKSRLSKDAEAPLRSYCWETRLVAGRARANGTCHWLAVSLLIVRAMRYSSGDNLTSARSESSWKKRVAVVGSDETSGRIAGASEYCTAQKPSGCFSLAWKGQVTGWNLPCLLMHKSSYHRHARYGSEDSGSVWYPGDACSGKAERNGRSL